MTAFLFGNESLTHQLAHCFSQNVLNRIASSERGLHYTLDHTLRPLCHGCLVLCHVLGHVASYFANINGNLHVQIGAPNGHQRSHMAIEPAVVGSRLDFAVIVNRILTSILPLFDKLFDSNVADIAKILGVAESTILVAVGSGSGCGSASGSAHGSASSSASGSAHGSSYGSAHGSASGSTIAVVACVLLLAFLTVLLMLVSLDGIQHLAIVPLQVSSIKGGWMHFIVGMNLLCTFVTRVSARIHRRFRMHG